eukprot:s4060_g9.t1
MVSIPWTALTGTLSKFWKHEPSHALPSLGITKDVMLGRRPHFGRAARAGFRSRGSAAAASAVQPTRTAPFLAYARSARQDVELVQMAVPRFAAEPGDTVEANEAACPVLVICLCECSIFETRLT